MRIAQLAPLVESVPPEGYGGTELVVHLLTEELVKQGHEVTLFASGDSHTSARLISGAPEYLRKRENHDRHRWAAYDTNMLLQLRNMKSEFDIVHNHMGWQALPFAETLNLPMITTNHNPLMYYCKDIYLAYRSANYVSISDAFKRFNFGDELNYVATVYNGIDVSLYATPRAQRRDHMLFIGRISAVKGAADAIAIAEAVGMPIKIAGKIDVSDQVYYQEKVKPALAKYSGAEYIGEVGPVEKAQLYSEAAAVVYPIAFEEPFGLVMAEAMAAGTPVLALDRGSVREVLSDGETAVIGSSVEELIQRFPEIDGISEQACRERARNLFSKEHMATAYARVYEQLCVRTLMSAPLRG